MVLLATVDLLVPQGELVQLAFLVPVGEQRVPLGLLGHPVQLGEKLAVQDPMGYRECLDHQGHMDQWVFQDQLDQQEVLEELEKPGPMGQLEGQELQVCK